MARFSPRGRRGRLGVGRVVRPGGRPLILIPRTFISMVASHLSEQKFQLVVK